ncbi:MAG TPA: LLM class F420-dependent oxidoreductase [Candidatus Binataceae bacterium]|jgi:F420-dependent oxidoreductase-like protein
MKLGLIAGYSGAQMGLNMSLILEAERLGFDSVWTAEAYGSDAVSPLAWIGAQTTKIKLGVGIMQMQARTPAMTAMTAMTIDALSGGRFMLGLGPSGPQVIEGWHGVPYGKPLVRTREYIQIVRKIMAREAPVEFRGEIYQVPYQGPDATGLGKPLKSILHGRKDLKIYTATISPKGIACAAEVADGFIPIWMDPQRYDLFEPHLKKGFKRAAKSAENFEVAPFVTCVLGDDPEKCRAPVKGMMALYIGGMGARTKNFYNDYTKWLGYEGAAREIQDLYLGGKRAEAMAAVPDELVDKVALVGPRERIKERLATWKASPVTTMLINSSQPEALRLLAETCL